MAVDEPFASIDLPVKAKLLDAIEHLAEQAKCAVVLVTHDPLEAIALCNEAVVLERGRLIESGALHVLLNANDPPSETVRAFRAQLSLLQKLSL